MNYRELKFMKSRFPALDALSAFVPTGHENDEEIQKMSSQFGNSRWFSIDGGHKVLFLYKGENYNKEFFSIEKEAWDHEHCKECGDSIPSMNLCWVTESGPFVVLCTGCYEKIFKPN
jgi:hypothetical protein